MPEKTGQLAGPAIMLVSALIFGFFGFFYIDWSTPGVDGEPLLFRLLLGWTLKVSAVLFVVSAVLTLIRAALGNLLYALTGVVGAGLFVVVAVMDTADQTHTVFSPTMPWLSPVVLVLFAAWNGYGSWVALRAVLAGRAPAALTDDSPAP
jgi:hypothetical protein